MQILIGLGAVGEVRHTELLSLLGPLQLSSLAHARLAHFTSVEVWEDTVCVMRCPPPPRPDPYG